jgi:hypothetical protein
MFTYNSKTGEFSQDGNYICTGYSGTGEGRNNPDMESVMNVGPIPRGEYTIGEAHSEPVLGPVVMNLDPKEGSNVFGRSLFRIHGDNATHDASHGCVILPRVARELVARSPDKVLQVV